MTIKNKAFTILLAIMMTFVMVPTIAFAEDTESIAVTGISLDQSSITVEEGASQTLTAIIEPENATNKNVLWSCDAEDVATVEDGVVTGVSAGTATVTATTIEGEYAATCDIAVTANEEEPVSVIPVTGISLSLDSCTVEPGDSIELIETLAPDTATNKTVSWGSSNEEVATVNDGVVTAIAVGTAEITATTEDGGFSATCLITVMDSSTGGTCGDNLNWKILNGKLIISGSGEMTNYTRIKATTDTLSTAPWSNYESEIVAIEVKPGVTSIGTYAFINFDGVTNISIADTVTSIGEHSFERCKGITEINIPGSVESIGTNAFAECAGVTKVSLSDGIVQIGNYAFFNLPNITSISIPNSVTSLGIAAFSNCYKVTSVKLSKNMTKISSSAFSYNKKLTSVSLPSGITTIDTTAFNGCESLRSVSFPSELTTIGKNAFQDCKVSSIVLSEKVKTIGAGAFKNCTISRVIYYGNSLNWSKISIGSENEKLTNAKRYDVTIGEVGYTGEAVEPTITVVCGSKTLTEGTNYSTSFSNNINKGVAYVTLAITNPSEGSFRLPFIISKTDASKAIISDVSEFVYTGNAIEPSVSVSFNDSLLEAGRDYTLQYSDNINAGKGIIRATFIGDYIGTATKEFVINPIDASEAVISNHIEDQLYTGSEIKPQVHVELGGAQLIDGKDYEISYLNNENVGNAKVIVSFINNYSRQTELSKDFNIKYDASQLTVASIPDMSYTGEEIQPNLDVRYGDKVLDIDKDYTAEFSNNVDVGTATVVVNGIGDYKGSKASTFKIKYNAKDFEVSEIPEQTYCGSAIKPAVQVLCKDKKLTLNSDYAVSYANNINAGTATIVIEAKGDYIGKVTKSFVIEPASLKKADLSTAAYIYNNQVKTPSVSVIGSVNTKALTKGTDYTVSYASGRKAVGKYSVTVKGAGNYQGTLTKFFTIKPSKAVTTSAKVTSNKMKVVAKAKSTSYGGAGLQIAYKPSGGSWKYATTTSKTKAIKVSASKKYSVKTRAYKKVGGVTYYGDWSKTISSSKKVKITFNANKGKVTTKSKQVWTNGKYGKLPKPKRSGYKFRGWYTKKSGGKKVTAKTYTKYYKNHTLYAHWFGPKGKGGKISKAEYNRIQYGMSYSDVCYLIGGSGDRISSYTDKEWIEDSHEEWVDTGYWDYDYDEYGNEHQYWVDDGYYETVDDGYWASYYHETYGFKGQKSGYVEFEFVDDKLEEIYTYGFK